ncbi:transposase [Streptomyces griseoruber]|uniref:transposase n=1 Tax=Streptomyces griseoruber TaxID=1943 RepID=UPI00379976A2
MGRNFLSRDRQSDLEMPRNVREWLPPERLCWKVLDVVELLDLSAFENSYRDDGRGGAAYPPARLIALLPYCYGKGVRSSRSIEQACWDDVGCRTITANRRVDHSTVARFVRRHRAALNSLFVLVLSQRSPAATGARLVPVPIDPATMVTSLDDLERAEYAERTRDPQDRRRYAVGITADGRKVLADLNRTLVDLDGDILADLGTSERQSLHVLLGSLAGTPALTSLFDSVREQSGRDDCAGQPRALVAEASLGKSVAAAPRRVGSRPLPVRQ